MIPATKMIALWNCDDEGRIVELTVVDIREQTADMKRLRLSAGACDMGWMQGNDQDNPLGLFLFLATFYGFRRLEVALSALREFGKVGGQTWTDDLRRRTGADDGEEE